MNVIKSFTNKSATDLTGKEGYFVKEDTSGVNVCSAITDAPIGVIVRGGETQSDVCIFGECDVLLGGTITRRGQRVQTHTDGTAVVSAGASSQDTGLALEPGIAGDLVPIFFTPAAKTFA
jgi:hypothetical protein